MKDVPCVNNLFVLLFQKVKIMEALSATASSVSPPFRNQTLSQAPVAPIHRKARILTRDPLREAGDSLELQVEDDARRFVQNLFGEAVQEQGIKTTLFSTGFFPPFRLYR